MKRPVATGAFGVAKPLISSLGLPFVLPFVLTFILLFGLLLLPAAPVSSDDGAGPSSSTLAPNIPLPDGPLKLVLVRPPQGEGTSPASVRVVRHGFPGSPERPNLLDLPADERSFVDVYAGDWLKITGHPVELHSVEPFFHQLTLGTDSQVVVVGAQRLELLFGTVAWKRQDLSAPDFKVSIGPYVISGRGDGQINRTVQGVSVSVESGQIDVFNAGKVAAVLGAGQEREFVQPLFVHTRREHAEFADTIRALRNRLDTVLTHARAGTVTGDDLVGLWDSVIPAAGQFCVLEVSKDPAVRHPDVVVRDIGEALRILGGYRFEPPLPRRAPLPPGASAPSGDGGGL
ncbi:MAG: hypothetical protein WCY01_00555 [Alkalispirochaeta sp.]